MQRAAVSSSVPPANSALSPDPLHLSRAGQRDPSTRLNTSFWWVGEIEHALENNGQTSAPLQPLEQSPLQAVNTITFPELVSMNQMQAAPGTWYNQHVEVVPRPFPNRQNPITGPSNPVRNLDGKVHPDEAYRSSHSGVPYSSTYEPFHTPEYPAKWQSYPSIGYQGPTPPPSEESPNSSFNGEMQVSNDTWIPSHSMQSLRAPIRHPISTSVAPDHTYPGSNPLHSTVPPRGMHDFQPSPAPATYYMRPNAQQFEASPYPSFNGLPAHPQTWNPPPTPCNTPGYPSEGLRSDWPPSTMAPRDVRSEGTLYPGAFTAPCQLSPPLDSKRSTETASSHRQRQSLRRRPKPADLRGKYLQEAATKSRYRKKATTEAAMQLATTQ